MYSKIFNKKRPVIPGAHLRMTGEDPQFFTSGHVRLEGGALLVQRATTLFLSADVILKSMGSPEVQTGPSTVVVCLSLGPLARRVVVVVDIDTDVDGINVVAYGGS